MSTSSRALQTAAAGRGVRVLVAIVNYRTGPLVVNNLRALVPQLAALGSQVVVVDNCSGDGSADLVDAEIARQGWSSWARVLRAPVNGGFAYGNNRAMEAGLSDGTPPDMVWLLNPDTEARPGALQHLMDFLNAHPDVGIAGSSTEIADGQLWPHAFRFPSIASEFATAIRLSIVGRLLHRHVGLLTMGDVPERVDWLPGASMLVRREVFEQVGPMDEQFFLYFEETDFCLRAARAGWQCWYVPASRVMHIVGQSTGVTGDRAYVQRRPTYWFESRRRYWLKHHGRAYAMAVDLAWLAGHLVWRLRRALMRRAQATPPHFLRDFLAQSTWTHWGMPANARLRPDAAAVAADAALLGADGGKAP